MNADTDFSFDDLHEEHGPPSPPRPPIDDGNASQEENNHDETHNEDDIVGSVPISRGFGRFQQSHPIAASVRPAATVVPPDNGQEMFELAEDVGASINEEIPYSSTVPGGGGMFWRGPR